MVNISLTLRLEAEGLLLLTIIIIISVRNLPYNTDIIHFWLISFTYISVII